MCFSDPFLPRNEPDRAVMDNRPNKEGVVWASWGKRNTWLDPYNTKNHDLIVEMAKEVEAAGADEIQFDYIRFPVDPATKFAKFPAEVETPRREVLLGMIKRVDEATHIPIGADVFGLTTFREGDPDGLGQSLNEWASHIDVFSPMLYLNGMTSLVPKSGKEQRAQKLIYVGVRNLRDRVGKGPVIRPFLQAFETGADYYTPEFIAEQIRGAREAGGDGFLFWHPGSNYRMVQAGMAGPARALVPFPITEHMAFRRAAWGQTAPDRQQDIVAPRGSRAGRGCKPRRSRCKPRRSRPKPRRSRSKRTKPRSANYAGLRWRRSTCVEPAHAVGAFVAGRRLEPCRQDFLGHVVRERAVRQAQHVGVVPHARGARGARVGAQRGAHAADLVGGHADAGARPAEEDAFVAVAARDRHSGLLGDVGPRALGARLHRSEGDHGVAARLDQRSNQIVNGIRLVGADRDAHPAFIQPAAAGVAALPA